MVNDHPTLLQDSLMPRHLLSSNPVKFHLNPQGIPTLRGMDNLEQDGHALSNLFGDRQGFLHPFLPYDTRGKS